MTSAVKQEKEMDNILIIGAGDFQLPLVQRASQSYNVYLAAPVISDMFKPYIKGSLLIDVRDKDALPDIEDVDILINNAGTQNEEDIDINLKGLICVTEKYGVRAGIRSVLNIGSASGHTGAEFPEYCASKGGVLAYTKNVAMRVAPYGATCNSLDPGGVLTPLNQCVIDDPDLWQQIMDETPLRRWATPEEIAEWAYFLTVTNGFCTGQNILVDGGESINYHFVWKD
jgi:NAD(P)-dependent dehydrogenase (short-subunit alcohol dehydrogenase family)